MPHAERELIGTTLSENFALNVTIDETNCRAGDAAQSVALTEIASRRPRAATAFHSLLSIVSSHRL
jgi:hypothetical protein